ncbi:MAG: spondin domain-containing protein [Planctomycetota bacterium]
MLRTAACLSLLAAAATASAQGSTATYRLTFDAEWSSATHPSAFPPDPHFSGLIGGTHNDGVQLWEAGQLATPGIELMAETGSKVRLVTEVNGYIADGTAQTLISGGGIPLSPGSVSVTFETSSDFPLLSVVTMIAPSPDWFVGTQSLSLRDGAGWIDEIIFDLWPYDSGTDSGASYRSRDVDTVPPEPIRRLVGEFPFTDAPRIGTYTLELLSVECAADMDSDGTLTIFDFLMFQNAFDAGDIAADFDGDGALTLFDFLAFQNAFDAGC